MKEEHAHEEAPEGPAGGADGPEVDHLVELDVSVLVGDGDNRVGHFDQLFPGHFHQVGAGLFGLFGGVVSDDDQF
ncbi:hypothetical protein ACFO5X_16780 [Seohaeicola nanhaiensis]|uniref:Uncharacterized protein n=1 Tax=Seohaeicola nanhaiensis TaxID=1387282 RepID=A0ABV9KJC9_9RHOB